MKLLSKLVLLCGLLFTIFSAASAPGYWDGNEVAADIFKNLLITAFAGGVILGLAQMTED